MSILIPHGGRSLASRRRLLFSYRILPIILSLVLLLSWEIAAQSIPLPDPDRAVPDYRLNREAELEARQQAIREQALERLNATRPADTAASGPRAPFTSCADVTTIPVIECEALVALYNSTDGANWTTNTNWLTDDDPCIWYRITCGGGHVTLVALYQNQLTGTIPAELGNLTSLQDLYLHNNNAISGPIPAELGNLTSLQYLSLYNNIISGPIPAELGNLTSLISLVLDNNQLTGTIPPQLGNLTDLQLLDVSNNQLSGTIPITLGNLTSLSGLDLSTNQLTGTIPAQLGNLTDLWTLYLYNNALSGTIPPALGNITDLQFLRLDNNQLSGAIPPELGNLSSLQELYLFDNQLTGTIPAQLGNLTNLSTLELWGNQLSGAIPPELGNLLNLEYMFLFENQLTGTIPAALGNLTSLRGLDLKENQLTGTIPPELGNLPLLEYLYLNHNQLSGLIPAELGNLQSASDLVLDNNLLSGSIPPELSNLSSLLTIYLHNNRLSGNIPAELDNLNSLLTLSLSGNELSGVPLELTNLTGLVVLEIDYNALPITGLDPALEAYLNTKTGGTAWKDTQTVPPENVAVSDDADGLKVTWTPILYVADGGHYIVTCDATGTTATTYTFDKLSAEAVFSGLPAGTYTCGVATFTPAHPDNPGDVTSAAAFAAPFSYAGQGVPPNDLIANPILFDNAPRQNYSLNIASATSGGDPLPPVGDPDCPVDLPPDAVGIHYRVPGDAPGLGGVGGIVISAGGPIWFSNRALDGDQTADTAIVIYEETGTNTVGAVVSCDDDNAPGEISVSNAKFDLDPAKNYRVVVWNEAAAAQGAIIDIKPATFDLFAPADDTVTELPPATFTWQPYAGAVSYTLKVGLTTDISKLDVAQRTPAADDDELTCTVDLCTLTVAADSPLDDYLNDGNYLWSVAASLSDTDPTIPLNDSNQVFRFVIGVVTPELVFNGGFETDANADNQPDGWTGKNLAKDKLKCDKPDKLVAYEGTCAYQFKGSSGENASLTQELDGTPFTVGSLISFSAQAKGKGIVSDTKIVINVRYTNGSRAKAKIAFGTGELTEYTQFSSSAIELNLPVDSVKLKIKHKNPTGKLILDDLRLITEAARSRTIPLPPDASNSASGLGSRRGG